MTIEVDAEAAAILRRVEKLARARGETLAVYLQHVLGAEAAEKTDNKFTSQADAWHQFVDGMSKLVAQTVPPGHVMDDDRDSMYDDRA